MLDVETVEDPAAVAALMDPLRARILSELTEPRSAASLAERVGLTRQKVNYHLRALEERGLAEVAEERKWGGLTERRMVATAASYVVSPAALGPVASDTERIEDRLSASYLVAVAARAVREVGRLMRLARRERKRLATLSIDTQIDFESPADRAAFTQELGEVLSDLVARYHKPNAPDARLHRLVVFAHPFEERPQ
ncbi:MAG: helix-turn-helix domain-containing protein [Planctomycetota bacterium]